MLIYYDPDEYENVSEHHTCPFHAAHPNKTFAGCTCSAGYSQRRRSPADIAKIKAERARKEEDAILAQAEVIKARRSSQDTTK